MTILQWQTNHLTLMTISVQSLRHPVRLRNYPCTPAVLPVPERLCWRKQGGSQRMIELVKTGSFLSAGVLWLCLQPEGHQPASHGEWQIESKATGEVLWQLTR